MIAEPDASLASDAAIDDGCPAWLVRCGAACVDLFSSGAHCGECDRPCGIGAGCVAGNCLPSVPTGPAPARCDAAPQIELGGGDDRTCAGALAAETFTRALCGCGDIGLPALGGRLSVDGFDSRDGPYAPGLGRGSVGANGGLSTGATLAIIGDVELARGLVTRDVAAIDGALRTSWLSIDAPLTIGGDAFVEGAISTTSEITIAGTLHAASGCASVPASLRAAACIDGPVEVEEPCRCEPLAIADLVEAHADPAQHDNDEVGLSPDVLAGPGASGRIDLACGHYYLSRIEAGGPITIAVHGHAALYVAGSILADAELAIVPDPGATLDVLVLGTILARAPLRIGDPQRPSATRVWVGGACAEVGAECESDAACCSTSCAAGRCAAGGTARWAVSLGPTTELAALVAAPEAALVSASGVEVWGAILGSFHSDSSSAFHFDRAIAAAGESCPPRACLTIPECGAALPCSDGRTCTSGCCVETEP